MYRKSFFLVILSLLMVGLLSSSAQVISGIPGLNGLPSSYDPNITVEEAAKTSTKPLLIEFYTDNCGTCRRITPWVHELKKKYKDDLTFVMVDANNPDHGQVTQIFGIRYVPALFVFDFNNMTKSQIELKYYRSQDDLDKGIKLALKDVQKKAASRRQAS